MASDVSCAGYRTPSSYLVILALHSDALIDRFKIRYQRRHQLALALGFT